MHSWRNTLFTGFLLMLMIAFMGVCVQLCLVENTQVNKEVCLHQLPVDLTPTAIRPSVSAQEFFPVYISASCNVLMNVFSTARAFDNWASRNHKVFQIPLFLTYRVLRI